MGETTNTYSSKTWDFDFSGSIADIKFSMFWTGWISSLISPFHRHSVWRNCTHHQEPTNSLWHTKACCCPWTLSTVLADQVRMSVFYELLSFFVRLVLGKLRDLDHFLEFGCVYSWIEFSELAGDVYVSSKKKKKTLSKSQKVRWKPSEKRK